MIPKCFGSIEWKDFKTGLAMILDWELSITVGSSHLFEH